jgi:uncharacterized Ntn-hydrolase superfamily protein
MSTRTALTSRRRDTRPLHTFSIVARDPDTGDMGVAVQSHWFSVGSLCPWARAGVGAIATQSFVNVSFGVRGLELLEQGRTAEATVQELVQADEGREVRQLAVVDSHGYAAAHTGSQCVPEAGHLVGDGYSVQANMMLSDRVWPAMARAFEESSGPLPERLVVALQAAQDAGGDIRGKQSAALLVVRAQSTGKVWEDRAVDLRVEDHPEPIGELRRLLCVHRAYEYMNQGDLALEMDDVDGALEAYRAAETLFPDNREMRYWHAVSLANVGRIEDALPIFRDIFEEDRNWLIMTGRLPAVGVLDVKSEDLERILAQGR